eukprot:CAMPEP_0116561860 /NCGR_PEP_ID=MMETSP0397-20121206/11829_1 /TAXON_ID=216820 /ORGANISM="Cyclophora tenuis, Strain ECT3854" /LENGTH=239 /DNA_ID=CAMNT_0004088073 /DNA_START=18 /DNA_END=734 /DNA_ORIENTATION=+
MLGDIIRRFVDKVDILGITSGLLSVGAAFLVNGLVSPRWPQLQQMFFNVYESAATIVHRRVWLPFWDIVKEYVSKKDSALLEFLDIENEIQSLDNMLRDLGFGDGTLSTREEALRKAARQYETNLQGSMLSNLASGRLVRLMLMQIQQLKAGLLRALEDIDSLVQSNRLNVRLLAAIPTVVLIIFATRITIRTIVGLRLRDIRPLRQVHHDMDSCLLELEKILIISSSSSFNNNNNTNW